ncbi:MAG: FprA family A-type flavoprotein [Candidatus Aegiribacteria sp.]|nr:FprA family A-type flavoprotein [Candidatus Aegiribacteria sp.]
MSAFKAVKLTEKIYWVGAVDWAIRDFHGYSTSRGTTYNAFLILADKITLIDTVKKAFSGEMMSRISSIIDPEEIDYIISNHSEMDHTGALPETISTVHPEKVFASPMGKKAIAGHFNWDPDIITEVKTGDSISLGNMSMTFIETRMLHWPDSMVSYIPEEKILFSQDGFGMHLASSERFDDELPLHILDEEALKYYANILMPFSPLVTRLIDQLGDLDLDVDLLCPDHGPVWRSNINHIIGNWAEWAKQKPSMKAVIVFDTMWHSTAVLADAICDGLDSQGISVRVMPLASSSRSDVATEVLDAGALIVGSPTINNQIFPRVADCMTYLKGLKPKNLVGAAFGSYGWSGEAVEQLESMLGEMNIPLASEGLKINYVPDTEAMEKARDFGVLIGKRIIELAGESG